MINSTIVSLEKSLIASILYRPEQFRDLKSHVPADMFSHDLYRKIAEGIHQCAERSIDIDTMNIATVSKLTNTEIGEMLEVVADNTIGGIAVDLFRMLLNEQTKAKALQGMRFIAESIKKDETDSFEIMDSLQKLHADVTGSILSHVTKSKEEKLSDYRAKLQNASQTERGNIKTSFLTLNTWMNGGFRPGDYVLIGGREGSGKTSMMLSFAITSAKDGHKTAFISGEMPIDECFDRCAGIVTGLNVADIHAGKKNGTDEILGFFSFMQYAPLEIFGCFENTAEELERQVSSLIYQGFKVIIVDYLQKFAFSSKAENEFTEIKRVSGILRNYALRSDVTLIVASGMNRNEKRSENLTLTSMYGSSALGHDATVGLILDADPDDKTEYDTGKRPVKLTIAKNRNGARGDISIVFRLRSQQMFESGMEPRELAIVRHYQETEGF